MRAHYTQIGAGSQRGMRRASIAAHAHVRELFAKSGRRRPGRRFSRRLVEARLARPRRCASTRRRLRPRAQRDCTAAAPRRRRCGPGRHAKLRRLGGARGARGGQHLHRARRHRAPPAGAARSVVRRLLAELPPARRAQLGVGRHREREGHHRHQSTRDRRCRFDPRAARRRAHRRGDDRRPGSGYRYRHPRVCRSAMCRSCRSAAPTPCAWATSCSRSAIRTG